LWKSKLQTVSTEPKTLKSNQNAFDKPTNLSLLFMNLLIAI